MSAADCIIVMARYPQAGSTKTRLIPALGATKAAELHAELVRQTLGSVHRFRQDRPCEIRVHFAGGDVASMQHLFGKDLRFFPQCDGSLGERLSSAVRAAFREGQQRVVVIGTDCPALTEQHLEEAFDRLSSRVITIGPACDGGYYLMGLSAWHPELFQGIAWSTSDVYQQTCDKAKQARLKVRALPMLSDIDHPEDLIHCRREKIGVPDVLPQPDDSLLSVIIPTLNEESVIQTLLESLKTVDGLEVIVADGGSTDRTCELAAAAGARVVVGNPGRGCQMNAGAALARGAHLLFVHADAVLPNQFSSAISETLRNPENAGGAFRLGLRDGRRALRLVEWGANLRTRWFQLPYGDQGLFVRAATFFQMHGFRNWPLMEDYEFSQRLRRIGKIPLSSLVMQVSARRWNHLGIIRTTLINQLCVAGFRLGVSPNRLHRLYVAARKSLSRG